MEEQQPLFRRLLPIILAAVAGALLASALWVYTLREHNRRHEADFRLYSGRVETLGERIEGQNASMRDLLAEYGKAQEVRLQMEAQLAESRSELERAQAELQNFSDGDWAGRLEEEQQRADALDTELSAVQQTLEESAAANAELKGQIEESAALVRKLKQQVDSSTGEIDKLRKQLAYFTSQQPKAAADPGQGYRRERIDSLYTAMKGRSSAERRSILASVIPAIPGGVSGGEFADLVKGMDSADVLDLIKSAQPHLQMPMADADREILVGLMSGDDAAAAAKLLNEGGAP